MQKFQNSSDNDLHSELNSKLIFEIKHQFRIAVPWFVVFAIVACKTIRSSARNKPPINAQIGVYFPCPKTLDIPFAPRYFHLKFKILFPSYKNINNIFVFVKILQYAYKLLKMV